MFDAPTPQRQSTTGDPREPTQRADWEDLYNSTMAALEQAIDLIGCIQDESMEVLGHINGTHPDARETDSALYNRARRVGSLADSASVSLRQHYDLLRKRQPLFPLA